LAHQPAVPPRADALTLFSEICRAVDLMHGARLLHRDLKPENLIRRREGEVAVIDFGLARALETAPAHVPFDEDLTRTGDALGTPTYMAPEQLRGDRALDERTDLYSLGVI
jgi:serine/threonine-protein kinase